jgi:hypothetical protein
MKEIIKSGLENLLPQIKRLTKVIGEAEESGVYNTSDSEDMYMQSMFHQIGDKLDEVRRIMRQVNAPVTAEGTLRKNAIGRYELSNGDYLTTGSPIEYLHTYSDGESRWVYSRIEHNSEDYYIVINPKLPLAGLWVRVKKLPMWD